MKIKFEPRDLWFGVFWDIKEEFNSINEQFVFKILIVKYLYIYICIIPCFPIIIKKKLK